MSEYNVRLTESEVNGLLDGLREIISCQDDEIEQLEIILKKYKNLVIAAKRISDLELYRKSRVTNSDEWELIQLEKALSKLK